MSEIDQNEQYPGFARAHAPYYWITKLSIKSNYFIFGETGST